MQRARDHALYPGHSQRAFPICSDIPVSESRNNAKVTLAFNAGCIEAMNWEAIGAIGEVVGAAGVIATLIYLAAQIRQNAAATRADIRQSLAEQQTQFINTRATDPFLRASMEKVLSLIHI